MANFQAKWTSLRNSCARILKKKRNISSASDAEKGNKFYLADATFFLTEFMGRQK